MIETALINSDGVYTLNNGNPTRESEGTIIIINPDVAHTYTVGLIREDDSTFHAFTSGAITEDSSVRHGRGAVLAVQVSGVTPGDNLQFGYIG